MSTPAIDVHGLRKSYGDKVVLDGVDLTVTAGTVTALLGPNGAGKTTIVNILSTLARPDGGAAHVNGCDVVGDPVGVRAAIGLTGQFSAVDGLLTGEENLLLMARLRHLGRKRSKVRVAELLEQFDLVEAARTPLATYSGGMRRRLDLAMTLVSTPSVIVLDEPTTGLDPRSRHTTWEIVRGLVAGGTTVLLTTQYLEEADQLADRVAVLLFVFVFGGTLGAGLPGVDPAGGRAAYLAYVVPGILVITIAGSAGGTATTVAMDMTEGITARFRSMAISRAAVLAGHVLGNTIQALLAVVLVLGVSLAVGFRPTATPVEWLGAAGLLLLVAHAISWLGVAMGMQARSVETASNLPLVLLLLPMLGSGFVPTGSMPAGLRFFAEHQPFTPLIETVRGLLLGTPIGSNGWLAAGWCVVLAAAGFTWSRAIYERKSVR